jgi:hypothetical protein
VKAVSSILFGSITKLLKINSEPNTEFIWKKTSLCFASKRQRMGYRAQENYDAEERRLSILDAQTLARYALRKAGFPDERTR